MKNIIKLDNPVWFSLSEKQKHFSIDNKDVKFYHPDYCPFGGFISAEDTTVCLEDYSKLVDNFFIVGEKPVLSNRLILKKELVCLQMIIQSRIETEINQNITALTKEHMVALSQLINLVQPGYFSRKTALLGNYFGIVKNDKLIAVAGERMQMNDYVEVSAVVTHPDYTGQGYAKQLVTHVVNHIFDKQQVPFLHVLESNTAAIKLYEKIGFFTRRKISFWNISK